MKKLLYLAAATGMIAMFAACEDELKNPGDFSVKSELELTQVRSLSNGHVYPLSVARSIDTTYRYYYTVYDTVKDAEGNPVLGTDGRLQISTEEKYYLSKITAKFVEFDTIFIPSYEDLAVDTLSLDIVSNANWRAPELTTPVTWYSVVNASSTGGGDGAFLFSVNQFKNEISRHKVQQDLFTRDSTLMFRLHFRHYGLAHNNK